MDIDTFLLERHQSLYENAVEINLTESGVEPLSPGELLDGEDIERLLALRLGYGHTEGTPDLRAAVATWYPGAIADNVLVTTGTAEANFIATWALTGPGTSIAFMVPNFMQIHGLGRAFGADVRTFPLIRSNRWHVDLDALRSVVDKTTRLIAIVNPNNPTGTIIRDDDLDAIAEIADGVGAWVLSDEIYRGAELDGHAETPTFWGRYDKTIVTASTSKSLAHAGLRIGWAVAAEPMIGELMRRQDYSTIGTGPINQFLAARLLEPDRRGKILGRSRSILQANIDVIDRWVGRSGGLLSYDRPEAGGMAFVAYDLPVGSEELARRAREDESVLVVAGAWFGLEGHIRIGTGGERETLEDGLQRLDRVFARIAATR